MRPTSKVRLRSVSRFVEVPTTKQPVAPAGVATTSLLAIILIAGPLVLGAARLWFELPLLEVVALLLLLQGVRLQIRPSATAPRRMDAIDLSVVVFVLYALVRWLTSPTEYFSRLEAINIVAYAGVFFTCRYGLARATHGLLLLGLLVALGMFETGFGYYLSFHSDINDPQSFWCPFGPTEILHSHYFPRWVGTYGCPNHYGALLVMATGAALALGSFSKLSWPLRIVLFYLAVMMMVGVMYSGSRGSWLGALAAMSALTVSGVLHGMVRWWVPLTGGLVLVGAFLFTFSLSPMVEKRLTEVESMTDTGQLSNYCRVELAADALRIAHDHLFFGTGPATFVFIHPRYQRSDFTTKAILTHDDYLNCLDDYGLVGFAIAMFFVAAVTLKFLFRNRAASRWQDRVLMVAGFTAWSALLFHSFVDFNLHIPANALMLFALIGMGLRRFPGEETPRHWSHLSLAPLGRGLGWAVIILSVAYGIQVGRTALSDIPYEKTLAQGLDIPTSQAIQNLKKALTFDPGNAQALAYLGDLYRFRASRQQEIEGRIAEGQKALDAYQRALKANPLDDTIEGRMGLTFDVMRRYSEAFFCYTEAVTAQPYDGQFWFFLGNHYWQRGLLEKAEEAYLLGAQCPHGAEGNAESAKEVRVLLDARGIPPAAPAANPLNPQPAPEEPATVP